MSERGGYRCCVKGCQSATSNKREIKETLFRFPKDAERLVYYVTCLAFTHKIIFMLLLSLSKYYHVS